MTHVVQIEKSLQKTSKCSDLLALFLKQTSAEVTGFDAKKWGASNGPPQSCVPTFLLSSLPLFYSSFLIYFTISKA